MDEARLVHPDREELESFLNGTLGEGPRKRVEEHVSECASCCDVLRALPHDALVKLMQEADTSEDPGETMLMTGPTSAPQSADDASEIPPELVDHPRYRIVNKLGSGGMGVVFQAEHRLMERPVALKVVNARLVDSDIAVERFRLEVKAAARLSHRNIVAAHDAEQAGNLHFLVMEFIEGTDLSELVRRRGKLPVLHACNYVLQAAHGLQHALEQGMVHRDIKPHNLMRTPKGTIKILDFGLARFASQQRADGDESGLTGDGMTLGTPDYIAPEQARDSRRADIRADIYSLGCTLYYLLTGQAPFPSGTSMEKVLGHLEREPTPLSELRQDIPEELTLIVQRMMAKDPADRFQTPADVVEVLKTFGKPRESTSASAGVEQPVSTAAAEPAKGDTATQNTFVDRSPTSSPPDQLDLPDILPAHQFSPKQTKRRSTWQWRKFLAKHGVALSAGGVGLLVLIAGITLFPVARERFSAITSDDREVRTDMYRGAEGWIDLLGQVDTGRDAVAGQWQKRGTQLAVDAAHGARLVLPFKPPRGV